MTGAGGSEKAVSWLYDFEEQEGEIDFLTRVVVFTFYAGSSGVPITIGEVLFCAVRVFLVTFILAESTFYEVLIFIFHKEFDSSVFHWRRLWFRSCPHKVCAYLNYLKCMVGWGLILWTCPCR